MREEVEMKVLLLDGKECFLVDYLCDENTYYYYANVKDVNDIMILMKKGDNLVLLDNEVDIDKAFSLFYQSHQEVRYRI